MNVIVLLVFVSLMIVVGALLAFAWSMKESEHEHADRLSLLPLDDQNPTDTRTAPTENTKT